MHFNRPAWAEISLVNFKNNLQMVTDAIPATTGILAVVKANAYGIGAIEAAKLALTVNKVVGLAVATPDEALQLRDQGLDCMILVLGPSTPDGIRVLVRNDISVTVASEEALKAANRTALSLGRKARIHLKVDTGMGRIGFLPGQEFESILDLLRSLSNVDIEGLFTHFSVADVDKEYTEHQISIFERARLQLSEAGIVPTFCHAANSAAIFAYPESHYDLVRPGIVLYGSLPDPSMSQIIRPLPVISIKARITHVKRVPPGTSIGYGRTFTTEKKTVIGTIPIGYADGYPRLLSNRGSVLVRGKRRPIVGRVCMDQMMFDAGDMDDLSVGEIVTLIGNHGNEVITVQEVADLANTIPHEVLTGLAPRLHRIYV
jgi:alanine racemase